MSMRDQAIDLVESELNWYHDEIDSSIAGEIIGWLDEKGYLAPDLPEPARFNHRNEPCWETEGNTSVRTAGMFPVSLNGPFGEGWGMHPPEARDVAYALLAAANYAEKE